MSGDAAQQGVAADGAWRQLAVDGQVPRRSGLRPLLAAAVVRSADNSGPRPAPLLNARSLGGSH